jgi:hypothetical protein
MRKVNSVDLAGLNDFFDTAQMNMKNTKPKLNMDRDDIMHLVNETAPRYESWGCEAHFQLFAKRLMEREREACAKVADEWQTEIDDPRYQCDCAEAIRARGEQ